MRPLATGGFFNRWYRAAMKSAAAHRLSDGLEIRVVTAPTISLQSSRRSRTVEREICSEVAIWKI
jgi:hypothetical protein